MRGVALAYVLGLAACFTPEPPGGLPCAADKTCPDGQTCNLITLVCDGTDPGSSRWLDDTAADFMGGTVRDEVAIEAGGYVGPIGSFTGGLRTRGIAGDQLSNGSPETFEDLAAMTSTGNGFSRTASIFYGTLAPKGVGLTDVDNVTVLIEGEIRLDTAGTYRFSLFADDHGFVDIADPGSATFTRLISDDQNGTNVTRTITTPGWYRIRGAFSDAGQSMEWTFHMDPPGTGGFRSFLANELRSRIAGLDGVIFDGFEQPSMFDHRGSTRLDTLDNVYGADPYEIDIGVAGYTARSSGQVLIDTDGDYAFDIDTPQGHRAWIDGASIVDDLGDAPVHTVTSPIHLVAGWHDLVVDVQNDGGSANNPSKLSFTIASGPVTGAIPSDHLRPVSPREHRFSAGDSTTGVDIIDVGTSSRPVNVSTSTLDTVEAIGVCLEFDHPNPSLVQVVVDPPVGANILLRDVGDLSTTPDQFVVDTVPVGAAGGAWALQVIDNTADMSLGHITMGGVTFLGHGGEPAYATSYHFESAVHELGDVFEFGHLAWRLRQGDASMATVKLRTCDDAAGCAAEAYVDVPFDTVPAVPVRRFAQYAIDIRTDGDVPTALDAVSLDYTVR